MDAVDNAARLRLPNETIEQILEHAWKSTTSAAERKGLFTTLAAADSVLHELLTRIATRIVILDVAGFSTDDIDFYAQRSCPAAQAVTGDECSSPNIDQYYNLEVPRDEVLAFRKDLFKNSHLRIEGLTGAPDHIHRYRDISCATSVAAHRRTWGYILTKLTHVVPDARSVTLTPAPGSPWPVVKHLVPALLVPTLRSFPSLRSVHFAVFFEVLHYASHSGAAPPALPQVTSLRLAHFPLCECPHRDWRPRRADDHLECCLAATLLESFPNLRHLHIENPVFLKTLRPPPSLETITLDAPPVERIQGREAFSSLIEYNVGAAVRRGFMSRQRGAAKRRQIVVLTGTDEPYGWMSARAACAEAGVELVKVVEYMEPVVRTDPMLIAMQSTADGTAPRSPTVLQAARLAAAAV